ncbi:ABC transporter substrate-binding protein [Bradyrhizobium jicamae]|uniref:ABC transporter substrate-binding protein n=1 Tax=Bradyrhizobium jicamae TaxID=280332 RepID=UPI001BA6B4B3|nr:ABC transporter substrate-binding protein [Bradyrhizobium jicamae]MBR0934122.1 ABC transporter substrate-binding protein [Bradyrhizobium jicamae]
MRKYNYKLLVGSLVALGVSGASAEDRKPIKVGVVATLSGAFAALGQEAMRGVEQAMAEANGSVSGHPIVLTKASSDATPDSAVSAVRKLVESDGVDLVVGPLSGDEGIAVKEYAKSHPNVTFVNGTSAAQDTTLRNPASNFFRFSGDGAQWMAGLGRYAFTEKGYRRVAVVAEDYSFPYTQVFGFMTEFCALGGHVVSKSWVPIGQKDYSSVVASLPRDIDALFVGLSGADAVNFLTQMQQGGIEKPMIAGTFTADQTILGAKGRFKKYFIGTPSASPVADGLDSKGWDDYAATYKAKFPDGLGSPSLAAYTYYLNTHALLDGLSRVDGDLADGHVKLNAVLAKLNFDAPTGGDVHLDANRQAITDNFVTEVYERSPGLLVNHVVRRIKGVNQTLGMEPAKFIAMGPASRDNPSCP